MCTVWRQIRQGSTAQAALRVVPAGSPCSSLEPDPIHPTLPSRRRGHGAYPPTAVMTILCIILALVPKSSEDSIPRGAPPLGLHPTGAGAIEEARLLGEGG
jgi:hypothetical protein